MIIKALAAAASNLDVPPYGYQSAPVPWALTLTADGALVSLVPRELPDRSGRLRPVSEPVPKVVRSGTRPPPHLACDWGRYVLGLAKPPKSSGQPYEPLKPSQDDLTRHEAWVALVADWNADSGGDTSAKAILAWVRAGKPGLAQALPSERKALADLANRNVAIFVSGEPVPAHLRGSAARFWAKHVAATKSSQLGTCVSCGSYGPLADTFPIMVQIQYAPGGGRSTGVALTSVNFATASRDLRVTQLRNAPTCLTCAVSSVAALTALAEQPSHCWRGDDAWTIWWLRSGTTPDIFDLLQGPPEPAEVARMFDQVRAGLPDRDYGDPADDFFALTYSARGPRIIMRSWITGTLRDAAAAIESFFTDSAVVPPGRPERQWEPVWATAKAVGERRHRGGRIEQSAPPGAHAALIRAALSRDYPPASLLASAVRRSRAEIGLAAARDTAERTAQASREHARVCLIRLILTRSPHLNGGTPVPGPQLDQASTDPAYLCGRLFAEYESTQRAAMGGDVNATITDRTYGKAMTSPITVYPTLDRLSKAHLRKLRTSGKEGTAAALDRRIADIVACLDRFPVALDVPGQARWMLGYYQQRAANINAAIAHARTRGDSPPDATLLPTDDPERNAAREPRVQ